MAVNFGQLFIESRGSPIQRDGKTMIMLDKLPAGLGDKFTVTIEATRSPYPQGIGVSEGVEVFGERVKRAVIWEYFSLRLSCEKLHGPGSPSASRLSAGTKRDCSLSTT
jgi:hypothetical protein